MPIKVVSNGKFVHFSELVTEDAEGDETNKRKIDEAAHIRLASIAATIGALENGLGCTLAPRSLFDEQLRNGKLRVRKLSDEGMTRTLYLGYMENDPATREREVVRDLIREIALSVVEDGHWPSARALIPND